MGIVAGRTVNDRISPVHLVIAHAAHARCLSRRIVAVFAHKLLFLTPWNFNLEYTILNDVLVAVATGDSIAHIMGFRNFELFGFDCSVDNVTDEMKKQTMDSGSGDKKPKYFQVETGGHKFWTTGELLAMAQDCEKLFDNMELDMGITIHGDMSLVKAVFENSKRGKEKHYEEIMNVAA